MAKPRVFLPPKMADLYERHEKLEIGRVTSLKRHHEKSQRYLRRHSPKRFRVKKIARLPGATVWLVDGPAIRRGVDVDFTMGGHGYRYLYVPLDEIWIDRANSRRRDLWPTIWHEYFERISMRNRISYEVAHKLACRLEIVLREGTYFVLPVGTSQQSNDDNCGPTALKVYLNYLGRNLSERYLARLCKTTAEKGTNPADLAAAARKLGFRVEHRGRPLTNREASRFSRETRVADEERRSLIGKVRNQAARVPVHKAWTAGAVKKSIRKGHPVLANIQTGREYGSGHYVLVIGFTKDRFVISDPSEGSGYREAPISEFMDLWYELEDGTVREGFTIY